MATGPSFYMYVARNQSDFIHGNGKYYVFKTDQKSAAGNPLHSGNLTDGQSIGGYFVEIPDPADLATAPSARYANLQAKRLPIRAARGCRLCPAGLG